MSATQDTRRMTSLLSSTKERNVPSKSKGQAKLMQAAAHNPSFAKKVGVPQAVARDFYQADKRKKRRRRAA